MNFDTIAGLYVYAAKHHSGQTSRLYGLLSRIERQYRPRLSDRAWDTISDAPLAGHKSKRARRLADDWHEAQRVYKRAVNGRLGQ